MLRILSLPIRVLWAKVKKRFGKLEKAKLEVFLAFGNENELYIKGRVVEAYKQSIPSPKKTSLQNILAAMRRYAGSSIPEVEVMMEVGSIRKTLTTNEEGIFDAHLLVENENVKTAYFKILPDEGILPEKEEVSASLSCYPSQTESGIISDIDDTILISHATKIGKKFWLSVSKNSYTRRPFPGVSEFYKFLNMGGKVPVFYVSSSDWNLFDLIYDFLVFRNIPNGPLLLKDLHVNLKNIWKSGGGDHSHKMEKIDLLMGLYPKMTFILVGDSGQHDPELYAQVIEKHPGRVKAVYIRRIGKLSPEREQILGKYEPEIDVAWVKDTKEALEHARENMPLSK
ncbi:App1 family protein [Pleomorphovibrio marinus]|uniref:App1 family protein n=1 Tax=Pleomorphovibrio marinus TaxID=2164132 RepID=UPI000E0BC2B3|nr:phosphatase domain-containing protein [Pleomorphovibrio marinus]